MRVNGNELEYLSLSDSKKRIDDATNSDGSRPKKSVCWILRNRKHVLHTTRRTANQSPKGAPMTPTNRLPLEKLLAKAHLPPRKEYINLIDKLATFEENDRLMPFITALAEALRVQSEALSMAAPLIRKSIVYHADPCDEIRMILEQAQAKAAEILERGVGDE